MREMLKKIYIVLGLYDLRTIISKFFEIFCYNRNRYSHRNIISAPEFLCGQKAGPAGEIPEHAKPRRGGKLVFFLVHCFYPYSQGGTERFIYNMAVEAKRDGNRVRIITYNAFKKRGYFKNNFYGILYNEYQVDGLDVLEYRHKRAPRGILKDIVMDDQAVSKFAGYLFKREKPDIVHAGYIQKVSSFIAACREYNVPYIITLTSFYSFCHFDIMVDQNGSICAGSDQGAKCGRVCPCLDIKNSALRYKKARMLLKDAAFITGPSVFVKNIIESEFSEAAVIINNHGVSRDFMAPDSETESKRKDVKSFAYIGSITPVKGIHLLIEAFSALPPEYKLNIYGAGDPGYLRQLARSARGRPNISFCGKVEFDKMVEIYMQNDVVVVPSLWYETYNFVLHEALLMNRAVIVSRIGAMPEKVVDGVNGYTFIPGDPHDLKRAMGKALAGRPAGNVRQQTYINTVEEEFSVYNRLYELAISEV